MVAKKSPKAKKKTDRGGLMSDKTTSKIPKTAKEKKMWVRSRQIAAKESGARSEKEEPWGLTTTIYKNAKKADKVPKKSDVTKAKKSKAVAKYKKPDMEKRKK